MNRRRLGTTIGLVLLVLAAAGLLAVLETYRGESALSEAQAAEAQGNVPVAMAAARVAAEARVPYTQHAEHASALLERLAAAARERKDPATAALALQIARQAAESTGDEDRAVALRAQESALAEIDPTRRSAAPRPTGIGRGVLRLDTRLALLLGIALLAAAAVAALRRPAWNQRLCLGLSVAGTMVLAAARFFG